MKQNQLFVRYASSALQAAKDQEDLSFFKEVDLLSLSYLLHPEWSSFFKNPTISDKDKKDVIKKAFSGKVSRTMEGFIVALSVNKRLAFFLEIVLTTLKLYKKSKGEAKASLIVPEGLSKKQEDLILSKMSSLMNLKLETIVKHSSALIGGFFFSCDSHVYDATVGTLMQTFTKEQ